MPGHKIMEELFMITALNFKLDNISVTIRPNRAKELSVEKMFQEENAFVQQIATTRERFSNPIFRGEIKKQLTEWEDSMQQYFDGMTEATIPKTVEKFKEALITTMTGAMRNCGFKVTLSLVNKHASSLTQAKNTVNINKMQLKARDMDLESLFLGESEFVTTLAANQEQFSNSVVRKRAQKDCNEKEAAFQKWFNVITEADLPKTVEGFHDTLLESMKGIMNNCGLKVVLALTPEKTLTTISGK